MELWDDPGKFLYSNFEVHLYRIGPFGTIGRGRDRPDIDFLEFKESVKTPFGDFTPEKYRFINLRFTLFPAFVQGYALRSFVHNIYILIYIYIYTPVCIRIYTYMYIHTYKHRSMYWKCSVNIDKNTRKCDKVMTFYDLVTC